MSLLIALALFLVMVSLGLNLPSMRFDLLRRRPALLLRVLVVTCIGLPLIAILLLHSPLGEGVSPTMATAVMIMAICPSAPMITLKSRQVANDPELAAKLQFWSACAAVISVPLWISQLPTEAGEAIWTIPAKDVAAQVLQVQLVPLLLGVILRRWRGAWVERWNPLIQKTASIVLLLLLVLILLVALPQAAPLLIRDLQGALLMLILTIAALGLGFLIASQNSDERSTLPLVVSMRNPGLALLLVQRMAPDAMDLKAAVVGYVLMTALGSAPFVKWRTSITAQQQIPAQD
tara:strand:- start:3402 stop:4274 length:873 start_codon:yes stop_codon:yes gene_type:complete